MAAEEPFPGGVDLEMAGPVTAAGGVLEEGEQAGGGITPEDGDGVVPTVRGVGEVPAGVDLDLGGGIGASEVSGQGGDGLERGEAAFFLIKGGGRDGVGKLVDDVGVHLVWGKGHVARARAGGRSEGRRGVCGERGGGGIELKDERLIGAEVWSEEEAIGAIEVNTMGVWLGLAIRVRAAALDFYLGNERAEAPICGEADGGDGAAAVVRERETAARGVNREVAGAATTARRFREQGEGSVWGDGECADFVFPPDGIEDRLLRVDGEEAGFLELCNERRLA